MKTGRNSSKVSSPSSKILARGLTTLANRGIYMVSCDFVVFVIAIGELTNY